MKTFLLLLSLTLPVSLAVAQQKPKATVPGTAAPTFTLTPDSPAAQRLWPQHREDLVDPLVLIKALHATTKVYEDQAKERALVTQLIAEPTRQVTAKELKGAWRVRSVQGGMTGATYGVYLYPWFKARITEKNGKLFFEKLTGSQRRSGHLYPPDTQSSAWLFAGGWTVNEDPQVPYSREAEQNAVAETDSTGLLLGLKGGRLLMISDVSSTRFELYELKR